LYSSRDVIAGGVACPRERGHAGEWLLELIPDRVEHPLFVGELAGLELGIDQVAVDGQLETAAA
jgi:hypothetical protein